MVDLNMPKKNGTEAIKELSLKKNFATIIFTTSNNDIEKNKCKELGVNDFFVKQSNFEKLIELVKIFKALAVNH